MPLCCDRELADGVFGLRTGKIILLTLSGRVQFQLCQQKSAFGAASCAFLVGQEKAVLVQPEC